MSTSVGVITSARSDYGHLKPLIRCINDHPNLQLTLYVTGAHLDPAFGSTVHEIYADGVPVTAKVPLALESDTLSGTAYGLSDAIRGFATFFEVRRPDVLVVIGDRFEMLGAGLAGSICGVPVAHISGGDVTEGSLDDMYRHALTKISHLHFPGTMESSRRIVQMGEEPWRVRVVGELSLDNLHTTEWLSATDLSDRLHLSLDKAPVIVTYHPVTLELVDADWQVSNLTAALDELDRPLVITAGNQDAGGRVINNRLRAFAAERSNARFVESLGWRAYVSLMRVAAVMIGNSSSGILEAPSFELPVVNIGTRQKGRLRAKNILDVGYETDAIKSGVARALDPAFRAQLCGMTNPHGDGQAALRITETLANLPSRTALLTKVFRENGPAV